MLKLKDTAERFIPTQSDPLGVLANLERYHYAAAQCVDAEGYPKKVLELGCGCGMGTYLYSLVTEHVTAVDYSDDAFEYAKMYPYDPAKVEFVKMDLEKEIPKGKYDLVIALEFLEHIEEPAKLLAGLNTRHLIFSLPFDSKKISTWHKYPIRRGEDGIKDVRRLIEDKYVIEDLVLQKPNWIYGKARKRKSWL
jgi:SAM-dependent methyltransferase